MFLNEPDSFRDISVPTSPELTGRQTAISKELVDAFQRDPPPSTPRKSEVPREPDVLALPALPIPEKRKEPPTGADELEPPAKRKSPSVIGETTAPNPGSQRAARGPGRKRKRFRPGRRNRRLRPLDPAEEGAVPAPGARVPPPFVIPGIPQGGQSEPTFS
jgi:hypothetical protein